MHVSLVVGEFPEENLDFLNDLDVLIVAYPLGARRMSDDYEYQNQVDWVEETIAQRLNPATQIILLSSTSVYPDDAGEVDETCTLLPTGPGLIQLNYEKALQAVFPQLVILRLAGLIGEGRHPGRFFAAKRQIPNPEAPVNLVLLNDVIEGCVQVIERNVKGETFNICADEHPERGSYYFTMTVKAGFTPPDVITSTIQNRAYKQVSSEKAKRILGITFNSIEGCE